MTIEDRWNQDYKDFNFWRKENDIPQLINSFNKNLPDFKIWKETFGITNDHLKDVSNIGEFFRDNEEKVIYKYEPIEGVDPPLEKYGIVYPKNLKDLKKRLKKDKNQYWVFTPYLRWAVVRKSWNKLIDKDPKNSLERFTYTLGEAPGSQEFCQWYFVSGFKVLKLGGVTLNKYVDVNYKNLDFVNLDHLKIIGDSHGGTVGEIFYSHIDNLTIENATWQSVHFYNCHIFNLKILNSKLTNFIFIDCMISGIYAENSNLQSFHFEKSSINGLTCINTSLDNIKYFSSKKNWFEGEISTLSGNVNTLEEFKLAFQANGHVEEAKKMFLRAKKERMNLKFHKSIYFRGFLKDLFHLRISRVTYTIKSNFISLFGGIQLLIPFLFWDFGRKPFLIFVHWILIILAFTLIYYYSIWSNTYNNFSDSFYTSVNCIFRMGLDINEFESNKMKILIGLESMISLFFIPVIVAGIINRVYLKSA